MELYSIIITPIMCEVEKFTRANDFTWQLKICVLLVQ